MELFKKGSEIGMSKKATTLDGPGSQKPVYPLSPAERKRVGLPPAPTGKTPAKSTKKPGKK